MSSFMEPEVLGGFWYVLDGPMGGEVLPADIVGKVDMSAFTARLVASMGAVDVPDELLDFAENGRIDSLELKKGYCARLSAPGYLDCTEWCGPYPTAEEAMAALREMYPDDDDDTEGTEQEEVA
jgi:hypothetical protein